jgi:hypothetical protein
MAKVSTYHTIEGLNVALRQLPKHLSARMRDASGDIAADIASAAASRARSVGGVAKLVAPTIKARRDRVPVVQMGGNATLPTSGDGWTRSRSGARQTIGDVIWGAEFGGGGPRTSQFLPQRDPGYFLWPTIEAQGDAIDERYSEALLDALEDI